MEVSAILRGARRGAGLSQRELARRTGIPQSTISRIERRALSPRVATLERLLAACGVELEAVRLRGDVDRTLIWGRLRMTPAERVRRNAQEWTQMERIRGIGRRAG